MSISLCFAYIKKAYKGKNEVGKGFKGIVPFQTIPHSNIHFYAHVFTLQFNNDH